MAKTLPVKEFVTADTFTNREAELACFQSWFQNIAKDRQVSP